MTIEDLSLHRWSRAKTVADASPRDALQRVMSALEEGKVNSVHIITIDDNGAQTHYSAGERLNKIHQLWGALNRNLLSLIEEMIE